MKVLVVDDTPYIREVIAECLEMEGHAIVQAGSLAEARSRRAEAPVDFILLDRTLPDGDGLELVGEVRAAGDRVPIVIISGRVEATERARARAAGVDDYLIKPFSIADLLGRLAALAPDAR